MWRCGVVDGVGAHAGRSCQGSSRGGGTWACAAVA